MMMMKISSQLRLTSDSLRGFLNRARGLQKRKPTLPSERLCSRHGHKLHMKWIFMYVMKCNLFFRYMTSEMSEVPEVSKAASVPIILLFVDLAKTCSMWEQNIGYRCEDFFAVAFRNDTFLTPRQCKLQCLQRPKCVQVDYSRVANQCLLYSSYWALLQPDEEFTSVRYNSEIVSRDACFRWIPFNDTIPTSGVVINAPSGLEPQLVARGEISTAVLPGKLFISSFGLWSVLNNNARRITDNIEYFDIHPSCIGVWIPYNSGSGIDLPYGAVQGGWLSDGRPLYVARLGTPILHLGYYDPATGKAYYAHNSNKVIRTEMDIYEPQCITDLWKRSICTPLSKKLATPGKCHIKRCFTSKIKKVMSSQ